MRQAAHKNAFAGRLAALIEVRGLQQKEVAEACGCTYQTVQKWLKGTPPGGEYVIPLARILHTDPTYLLTGEESTAGQARTRADAVEVAKAEIARALREAITRTLDDFESATASLQGGRASPKKQGSGPVGGPQ